MNTTTAFNIPVIGFGTYQRDGDEAYRTVATALQVGYRHIDTAEGYNNEEFVGQAIADSSVARDEIFITTKVSPKNLGTGKLRAAVETSLTKLQTDQVDLLLIHWPSPQDEVPVEVYIEQLAAVYDAGLSAHIGVSNFTKQYIDAALPLLGDRPIRTNQVEIHPYMQNRPIVEHCAEKGIRMTAYSPLAKGAVASDPVLAQIGERVGATAAQVALAYLMAEGHIVIPTSSNDERIAQNFGALQVDLSEADRAAIRQLEEGRRIVNGAWCPTWDV